MTADPRLVVLTRTAPLPVRGGEWTPVPMDNIYGGDHTLWHPAGHVMGAPGYWLHACYLRISAEGEGQGVVQFARAIGTDNQDGTGANDWRMTPGRDYVAHVWPFQPALWQPTGVLFYSTRDVTVEYAQLKAVQLGG